MELSSYPTHSNSWPLNCPLALQDQRKLRPMALSFAAPTHTSWVPQRRSLPEASPVGHTLKPEEASSTARPPPGAVHLAHSGPSASPQLLLAFGSANDTKAASHWVPGLLQHLGPEKAWGASANFLGTSEQDCARQQPRQPTTSERLLTGN